MQTTESCSQNPVVVTNQWEDFLLRKLDPYAKAKYDVLISWISPLQGQNWLVVGSGSGEFAAMLALSGAQVTAIDIDEASVELTRQTARDLGAQLTAHVSKLEDYNSQTLFDGVAATDVIEHIQDDEAAMLKICDLTLPGGRVLITVPALSSLFGYHDEVLGHFRRYGKRGLDRLLKKYVKVERVRYFGFSLIPVALTLSRILRRPYPVAAVGKAEARKTLMGAFIRGIFKIEKSVPLPLGISLLALGRKSPIQ